MKFKIPIYLNIYINVILIMDTEIIIKADDKDILLTFDTMGNIYFAPKDDPDKLFDLSIDNKNILICDQYKIRDSDEEDNNNKSIKIGELFPLNDNTLRGRIIKNKKENDDDLSDDENEIFNEENIPKYFSENLEFNEYLDTNEENEAYISFNFVGKGAANRNDQKNNKLIFERDDILALYDALIYEGTIEKSKLLLKTSLINDNILYRIVIFTDGSIKFRPIGECEKLYKLKYDANKNLIEVFQNIKK